MVPVEPLQVHISEARCGATRRFTTLECMLNFNMRWRFRAPADDEFHHGVIPAEACQQFSALIRRFNPAGNQNVWEAFKERFRAVTNEYYGPSTNAYFAQYDCREALNNAAANAPMFIEAFYDVLVELQAGGIVPDFPAADLINELLAEHRIGYRVRGLDLVAVGIGDNLLEVQLPVAPVLADVARETVQQSLTRASDLLSRGEHRAAVMETLWLLDSVSTVYRGVRIEDGEVRGAYFNTIVTDLRRLIPSGTLPQVLRWVETLYGYLSAPGGGQIRHGMDLSADLQVSPNDARLYCNLIRSYIDYLLSEYERLAT